MYREVIIFLLLTITILSCKVSKIPYDKLVPHVINAVDYKTYNYKEIKPIANLFKEYDIVTLAESTHIDGTTLDAQSMIIKALLDSGVINTIYFESGWLTTEKINSIISSNDSNTLQKTIPYACCQTGLWVEDGLWQYLIAKVQQKKVRLVAFDLEGNTDLIFAEMFYKSLLLPSVKLFQSSNPLGFNYIREMFLNEFRGFYAYDMSLSKAHYDLQLNYIDGILSDSISPKVRKQWEVIRNYMNYVYVRQSWASGSSAASKLPKEKVSGFFSYRDSVMATILLADFNSNKNVKAIAIMSSYHALSNPSASESFYKKYVPLSYNYLGDILKRELPHQVYSIIFPAAGGFKGRDSDKRLTYRIKVKSALGSLEHYYSKREFDYFFSDLKHSPLNNLEFPMSVIFNTAIVAKWGKMYDGIFFIRKMYPLKFEISEKNTYRVDSIIESFKKYEFDID